MAGGGGGGRGASAGGGGGGGLLAISSHTLNPGSSISIEVGKGGIGSTSTTAKGLNGGNSSFGGSLVSNGGGGGGSSSTTDNTLRTGNPGGSGGGGAYANGAGGGLGTSGQGNNGGAGENAGVTRRGAGGGGAGSAGLPGTGVVGGNGGIGFTSVITNSSNVYGAGGGGLGTNGFVVQAGSGGSGIGGIGNGSGSARHGQPNTGSGGGATSDLGGGGNGAAGIVIVRQTFRILPVELLYVDAVFRRESKSVELAWATGKEWNNSHFEVQRSGDGAKSWQTIGSVPGLGWADSKTTYGFVDGFPPLAGGLLHYRLKQADFDGRFALSKVVAVRVPHLIETKGTWIIYPNPVRSQRVKLELMDSKSYFGESIGVKVIHPMGEVQSIRSADLVELENWLNQVLSHSHKGLYLVEVSWGKFREYHKILSQE